MSVIKVGVATVGDKGLNDKVSSLFARAKTFTIIEIEDNKVRDAKVLQNPAASLSHGRGPIIVQTLTNQGIDVVIASEFGPSVSAMLDQNQIERRVIEPKTLVTDAVKGFISTRK